VEEVGEGRVEERKGGKEGRGLLEKNLNLEASRPISGNKYKRAFTKLPPNNAKIDFIF
jgi:hypothetical protein